MLQAALELAAEGMAVFPLIYGRKEPSKKSRGFYDGTTNPATIRRWFGGTVRWNIGIRTGLASGVWILDVDDPDALKTIDPLPVTRQSASSRGAHLWFKTPPVPLPTSSGRIAPGLDVKAEGGYVVAPPSLHPDGVFYQWLNDAPIVEAPSWLLVLARKPTPAQTPTPKSDAPRSSSRAYGAAALKAEVEILAAMPKDSGRNNQLNKSAFNLSQLVASGDLVMSDVRAELIKACVTNGLWTEDGERQCLATIDSGIKAGLASPRKRGDQQ